ncbi:Dihydrofolate reductase type 3 [Thalassocella blandensis]|nr:Dihydrofolate reductase type 3 [Thalassocella blandensis]
MAEICIVVAVAENGVIGVDNGLPWKLSADLKYFKQVTMGHPMVMGRLTFDSIGRPLPGRKTVVVTRQQDWSCDGVDVAHDLTEALQKAQDLSDEMGVDKIMLVGGAQLYKQALPLCQRLYLTRVEASIDGDAFFPALDLNQWEEVSNERYEADSNNSYAYSFLQLKRKS